MEYPQSIAEAIKLLDENLPKKEKKKLKSMEKDDLISLHFGFGMGLRNSFGIWQDTGFTREMKQIMVMHPDDMSAELIEIYWEKLNDTDFQLASYLQKRKEKALIEVTSQIDHCTDYLKQLHEVKHSLELDLSKKEN